MKTARDMFYFKEDIMEILRCKDTRALQFIRMLNAELDEQGKVTYRGRVPQHYFRERFAIPENEVTRPAAAQSQ